MSVGRVSKEAARESHKLMQEVDTDGDQRISLQEFTEVLERYT